MYMDWGAPGRHKVSIYGGFFILFWGYFDTVADFDGITLSELP